MAAYDVVPQADDSDSDHDHDHDQKQPSSASFRPLPVDFDNLGRNGFMSDAKVTNNGRDKGGLSSFQSATSDGYDMVEDDEYDYDNNNNDDDDDDDDTGGVGADRRRLGTVQSDTIDDDHNVVVVQRGGRDTRRTEEKEEEKEEKVAGSPERPSPSHHHPLVSPPLAHPTPDLQSLQGAYVGNVERLEKSAESFGVSSTTSAYDYTVSKDSRSSVYFSSGPHRASRARAASGSAAAGATPRVTRAAIEPGNEDQALHHHHPQPFEQSTAPPIILPPPGPSATTTHFPHEPASSYHHHPPPEQYPAMPEDSESAAPMERPASAGSTNTYQQATSLFQDFDGVHFTLHRDDSAPSRRRISLSKPPLARNSEHHKESVPGQNMVYYPAPVPKVLNLPQRLAKKPAAAAATAALSEQEKRRTQVVGAMGPEARQSAAWLPNPDQEEPQTAGPAAAAAAADPSADAHESKRLSKLPPQLRASAFFEQPPAQLDVQLKQDSAVATLDSILDAAAHAPVRAFTDHPIVGEAGARVYKGRKGKKLKKGDKDKDKDKQKHRSTASLAPPGSRLGGRSPPRDSAAPSLNHIPIVPEGEEDNDTQSHAAAPTDESTPFRTSYEQQHDYCATQNFEPDRLSPAERRSQSYKSQKSRSQLSAESSEESEDDNEDEDEEDDGGDDAQEEIPGAAPTTLLAELQSRQKELKQRNRTAATAFPNGMHSTLLELDAVAQRKRQTRNQKHVTLAWEDPDLEDRRNGADDDDVPLGVLFPEKNKAAEEQRPGGLMEQLRLDENEPLSRRRARMRGEDPDALATSRRPSPNPAASAGRRDSAAYTVEVPGLGEGDNNNSDDENEGETLAQRLKRLKSREGGAGAGAGAPPPAAEQRPLSSDFASELLSTFQPEQEKVKETEKRRDAQSQAQTQLNGAAAGADEAEETLGQRRKRLQAASAAHNRNKSNLTARSGMANNITGHNNYRAPNNNNLPQGPPPFQAPAPAPAAPIGGGYPPNGMPMSVAAPAPATINTAVPSMMQGGGQPLAPSGYGYGYPTTTMMNSNNTPYAQATASPYGNGMSSVNFAYYPNPNPSPIPNGNANPNNIAAAAAANRRPFAPPQITAEQAETIDPKQRAMIDRWRLSVR